MVFNRSKLFLMTFLFCLTQNCVGQDMPEISIHPANPKANDSIFVVSQFSYHGNCDFGLVYPEIHIHENQINLLPLYCGFGSADLCETIDTLYIGPLPNGNYQLQIDYHQGSLCPVSNFDIILATIDTTLFVDEAVPISKVPMPYSVDFVIRPNPSKELLTIDLLQLKKKLKSVIVLDLNGRIVCESDRKTEIDISNLSPGQYLTRLEFEDGTFGEKWFVLRR